MAPATSELVRRLEGVVKRFGLSAVQRAQAGLRTGGKERRHVQAPSPRSGSVSLPVALSQSFLVKLENLMHDDLASGLPVVIV
jgi:hypothetical protein